MNRVDGLLGAVGGFLVGGFVDGYGPAVEGFGFDAGWFHQRDVAVDLDDGASVHGLIADVPPCWVVVGLV